MAVQHNSFDEEQSILSRVWFYCKKAHDELQRKKDEKTDRRDKAAGGGKESYGDFAILKREIRELDEKITESTNRLRAPYFGRLQFSENGINTNIYIGNDSYSYEDINVVDWKAPVATMFYSREGTYTAPEGKKNVSLQLVRKLRVVKNVLEDLEDQLNVQRVDAADRFLLQQLQRFGRERLLNIVTTIQKEQNAIIREPMDMPSIIQGGAGTGKTIVLVYRIAYLMYTHKIKDSEVLLITPSQMLRNYIGSVLPDVELTNISTRVLDDFISPRTHNIFKDMKTFPEILAIDKKDRMVATDAAGWKGTWEFKSMLDKRMDEIAESIARNFKTFSYEAELAVKTVPASLIRKWFLVDFQAMSLKEREKAVRVRLKERLDNVLVQSASGRGGVPMHSPQEREAMLARYFKDWPDFESILYTTLLPWYKALLQNYEMVSGSIGLQSRYRSPVALWSKYFSMFNHNDWAAVFYMSQCFIGSREDQYRIVAVDEAQMLSPLWLEAIKRAVGHTTYFLLTGDTNQKPAVISSTLWTSYRPVLNSWKLMELSKCYRLTGQIAEVALEIIKKYPSFTRLSPLARRGEEVLYFSGSTQNRMIKTVRAVKNSLSKYDSIAFLCRTEKARQRYQELFTSDFPELTFSPDDTSTDGSISLLPVGVVGGLEFDMVVILDHKEYDMREVNEARMLYLGVTRAVHKLIMA